MKKPARLGRVAAGDDLSVAGPALQKAGHAFLLFGRVDRPERGVGRERVSDHEALRLLGRPVTTSS